MSARGGGSREVKGEGEGTGRGRAASAPVCARARARGAVPSEPPPSPRAAPVPLVVLAAELNVEQQGLLEMIVLSRGATFTGYTKSSMSFFVAQLRVERGHHPLSNYWVASAGTNFPSAMFQRYAVFSLPPDETMRPF